MTPNSAGSRQSWASTHLLCTVRGHSAASSAAHTTLVLRVSDNNKLDVNFIKYQTVFCSMIYLFAYHVPGPVSKSHRDLTPWSSTRRLGAQVERWGLPFRHEPCHRPRSAPKDTTDHATILYARGQLALLTSRRGPLHGARWSQH